MTELLIAIQAILAAIVVVSGAIITITGKDIEIDLPYWNKNSIHINN